MHRERKKVTFNLQYGIIYKFAKLAIEPCIYTNITIFTTTEKFSTTVCMHENAQISSEVRNIDDRCKS